MHNKLVMAGFGYVSQWSTAPFNRVAPPYEKSPTLDAWDESAIVKRERRLKAEWEGKFAKFHQPGLSSASAVVRDARDAVAPESGMPSQHHSIALRRTALRRKVIGNTWLIF